jgi:hypothetical protein
MNKNIFFPYSWFVDDSETEITSIRVYGIGENNENICLRITDFTPYIYLELPSHIPWNDMKAQMIGNKLDELMGKQKPLKKCLMYKYKLYGANLNEDGTRKKYPFLFCSFSTRNDIRKLSYDIQKKNLIIPGLGAIKLKMHEQDADPILQLTVAKDLPTAGWIKFSGQLVNSEDDKITLCDLEYKVKWKNMIRIEKQTVGLPKIMGFDIEVNSSNPSSMPKVEKPEDKIFQVSCVFAREGSKIYTPYLLTLGNPIQELVGENVKILRFLTEADLLIGFTELIRTENPNIIVGYNILSFDIPYMIDRSKRPCRVNHVFDTLGFHKYNHAKEKIIKWSSSAYKNQEFKYLDGEGRLFVDLLPLVKRDFKMDNYRLKTVSDYFLGQTKDDLSVKGIFKCYRIGTKKELDGTYSNKARKAMSVVGKYCVVDSELTVKLMDKLQTFIGLTEMSTVCCVQPFTLYTQGQQIKVYSQVYKYCYDKNILVEKDGYICKDDERYTGAHVFPPVPGLYNKVVPFDFCLTGDTLITLSNGTSKRIDMLYDDQLVLGFNKNNNGYENYSSVNGLQKKGKKETVKITLQDGRNIICTPDHKFMDENNIWYEAKDLKNKWVKTGIEYPEDIISENEEKWRLEVNGHIFSMENNEEREKSLAFARILGYLLSDGSIYTTNIEESYCKFCNIIISTYGNLERHYLTETCKNNRIIYENNKNIHNTKERIKSNIKQDERFKKNRSNNRPKNKQNIYTIFSKIEFKLIQKENPLLNSTDIFKEIGKKWQQIKNNKNEMEKYYSYIKDDEDRYNKEIKEYNDTKINIKPKKNIYIIFSLEEREKLKKEGIPPSKEINLELSKRWKIIKNNPTLLEYYKILEKEEELRYKNEFTKYTNKDVKIIKKTRPIFWFFYDIEKDNLYKKYPKLSGKEIMKQAQNLWKEIKLDTNEYEKYKKMSEEDKVRYNKELNKYIPNKIFKDDIKINKRKVCEAAFGTLLDAQNFMNDIKKFVDKDISIRKRIGNNNTRRGLKGTTYNITLPVYITNIIHSLEDIVIGKRTIQNMKFPKFLLDDNCPTSIIKEFISGLYGGDGHTVCLSRNRFSNIAFSWCTIQSKIEDMLKVFNILLKLHNKIGIECRISEPVLVKYKEDDPMIPLDIKENPRYNISLKVKYKNINLFFKNICFKYCINKQYKLVIANSYYNYKYNNNGNLDINDYLKLIKTDLWFKKRTYSVKQDDTIIPSYRQKVIKIENNGIKNVYDIEVNNVHNFLANGAVSHNCSLYPTT